MPEKKMTLREAFIVLDKLNTDGRIEVDREELREAIKVIKGALMKQITLKPMYKSIWGFHDYFKCPNCNNEFPIEWETPYCGQCGQAFDLSD